MIYWAIKHRETTELISRNWFPHKGRINHQLQPLATSIVETVGISKGRGTGILVQIGENRRNLMGKVWRGNHWGSIQEPALQFFPFSDHDCDKSRLPSFNLLLKLLRMPFIDVYCEKKNNCGSNLYMQEVSVKEVFKKYMEIFKGICH